MFTCGSFLSPRNAYASSQVDGLPEGAKPSFSLQLSSPVEEQTLDKLFDPLAPTENLALFEGVEVSQATLTVSAKDADIALGVSESLDVAPLCPIDATSPQAQHTTELAVAIVAATDAEEESKEGDEESKLVQPTCTITLRVTYKPSAKDQREELYDLLNKASQKKVKAIDRLRQCASAVSRATPPSSTDVTKQPAIQPGFLNKKKKKKEKSKWKLWYDRTLGPQSFVRQVMPIMKNYVIFFGAMAIFHFKGQEMALPAPV